MTRERRTCLACGRPLTGRQRKWCGHPDCGGWEAVRNNLERLGFSEVKDQKLLFQKYFYPEHNGKKFTIIVFADLCAKNHPGKELPVCYTWNRDGTAPSWLVQRIQRQQYEMFEQIYQIYSTYQEYTEYCDGICKICGTDFRDDGHYCPTCENKRREQEKLREQEKIEQTIREYEAISDVCICGIKLTRDSTLLSRIIKYEIGPVEELIQYHTSYNPEVTMSVCRSCHANIELSNNPEFKKYRMKGLCVACGRPLTGRQRKWCNHPDCGGYWDYNIIITKQCSKCGKSFETYRMKDETKCYSCQESYSPPLHTCIECGKTFHSDSKTVGGLWCKKKCHDRYFQRNPPPDFFKEERILARNNQCLGCGVSLESVQIEWWQYLIGFCSLQCDAVYHAKDKFKRKEQDKLILEEHGPELVEAFSYARFVQSMSLALLQWQSLSFDRFIDETPGSQTSLHNYREEYAPPEYKDEFWQTYLRLCQEMEIRQKLGLPEDAPLPEKIIPLTTEAPIKIWLEENNIEFETQKYFEISDTFTLVDFFIPLPNSDTGICLYCDGNYWHGSEFPETQEKDKLQVKELEKLGHIVIRLWETDIENGIRPLKILELLKQ